MVGGDMVWEANLRFLSVENKVIMVYYNRSISASVDTSIFLKSAIAHRYWIGLTLLCFRYKIIVIRCTALKKALKCFHSLFLHGVVVTCNSAVLL